MQRNATCAALRTRAVAVLVGLRVHPAPSGTVLFATGLDSPTYLTFAPGDPERLFVIELGGDVEILDGQTGTARRTPFLTVPRTSGGGLRRLGFDPDYAVASSTFTFSLPVRATSCAIRAPRSILT